MPCARSCVGHKRTVVSTKVELPQLRDQVDMKQPLILSLVLLGMVSAFRLEASHPHLETPKREEDLQLEAGGSEEQGRELVLTQATMQTKREEVEDSEHQDIFEDEESDPDALDEDLTCPKEGNSWVQELPLCAESWEQRSSWSEDSAFRATDLCDTLAMETPVSYGRGGGKRRHCKRCYRGNLASIHSYSFNYQIQSLARKISQSIIWIGGILKGWFFWKKFCWTDGSRWDFGYWGPGQPGNGGDTV